MKIKFLVSFIFSPRHSLRVARTAAGNLFLCIPYNIFVTLVPSSCSLCPDFFFNLICNMQKEAVRLRTG